MITTKREKELFYENLFIEFQKEYLFFYKFLKRHSQNKTAEILAVKYFAMKDEYLNGNREYAINFILNFLLKISNIKI